jgi:hypothetical protein
MKKDNYEVQDMLSLLKSIWLRVRKCALSHLSV